MSIKTYYCYYCKSSLLDQFIKIEKFNLHKCANCGLLMTSLKNRNNINNFNSRYYSNEYIKNYYQKACILNKRFFIRVNEIEKNKNGGRILDLGCGLGLFLGIIKKYSKYSWDCFGVDVNKRLIKIASKNIKSVNFINDSLLKAQFSKNYFDCITCFDVLEHDIDILSTIREIRRVLKSDGLLVIQSPNYKSIMSYFAGKNWDWWSVPDHIIHFSPSTLRRVLEDNGFRIKYIQTWEPIQDFVGNIRGALKKELPEILKINKILSKASIALLYILWFFVWILEKKLHIGGLILVYARKK